MRMAVELTAADISAALTRAGPVERQGIGGAREQGNGGAIDPPLRSHHFFPLSKGKETIQEEEIVEPVVNGLQVGLEFIQDKTTGRSVIRVYDRESGELIRQIPPEEILAFLRQIATGKGVLVSRRL